jgi:pimeloyl-ACP methyl ester carboxylesterase
MSKRTRPAGKIRWRRLLIWLVGLTAAYFGICYLLARSYVSPSRVVPVRPHGIEALRISGTTAEIPLWATPGITAGKPQYDTVFVLVHGYGGNREGWAQTMLDLHDAGFEAVAPELPAHGESPVSVSGFGTTESQVVLDTASWVREKGRSKVSVVVGVGVSMGAAALWLASEGSPNAFDAIVSEDSFSTLDAAADRWFDMLMPGGRFVLAPVRWFGNRISGVDSSKVRPVDAAVQWRNKPALVIHAGSDRLMAAFHSKDIARAAQCELWEVPEAGHSECYFVARREYLQKLVEIASRAKASR